MLTPPSSYSRLGNLNRPLHNRLAPVWRLLAQEVAALLEDG
jgi:hypothetical protein